MFEKSYAKSILYSLCDTTSTLSCNDALNVVLKVVNHIKSRSLRDRFFRKFCNKSREELVRLVLHTEVRGLSKGNCLQHFIALCDSIIAFLNKAQLGEQLFTYKFHIFYISDIFEN